ncbi:MAG: VOC family protein [Acidimicrobiales bacterium]
MRDPESAFHLAIPARDLDETQAFYVNQLGCHLARRYDDRITLDFFGDQVVCHLSDAWDRDPLDLYPRHFGATFRQRDDFESLQRLIEARGIPFHRPCQARFEGLAEEHLTMVIRDPSNNLIEFKWYRDPRMIY